MSITAKEIAAHLQISAATVSMVLNGKPGISDATRERVMNAALQLGYIPKEKTSSEPKYVQLVFFKRIKGTINDNPFFSQIIEGIDATLQKKGYSLAFSYFYKTEDPDMQLQALISLKRSGILLFATDMYEEDFSCFESLDIPVVVLDNSSHGSSLDSIMINNTQGIADAVSYLVQQGHTHIGYLASRLQLFNFDQRRDSYYLSMQTYRAHGILLDPIVQSVLCPPGSPRFETPVHFPDIGQLPTAFVTDNDFVALQYIYSLQEQGVHVPEDVSIIGFDNLPDSTISLPALTTLSVPKYNMGRLAAERLVARIENPDVTEVIQINVSVQLVERDSVCTRSGTR